MAYRLEPDEPIGEGLRRSLIEELQSASTLLATAGAAERDEAIHEARRCLKRARSALRLVRTGLGARFARENARLRNAGQKLSPFRDAVSVIEALDALRTAFPGQATREFRAARANLVLSKKAVEAGGNVADVQREVAEALAKPGRRWRLAGDAPALVDAGLRASLRAGSKVLAQVLKDPRPERLHALRKRVKERRLQLRLLGRAADRLRDLDDRLGEDHNLWLLSEKLGSEPARYGEVLRLIGRRRKALQAKALKLAEKVFGSHKKDL